MASQESKVSPLRVLGWLLQRGPPLLSALRGWISSYEDYLDFVLLIREFVPEHEAEILRAGSPPEQMGVFAALFETRYFPLSGSLTEGMAEEYADLTRGIPIDLHGIEYDTYLEPDVLSPGYQLMSYLVQSDEEGRTPLAEVCARHVPISLLERVGDGFPLEDLRELLADTRFEGMADWAGIWRHSTGIYFLDATYEDGYDPIDWSRENVESLTEEWQRTDLIFNRVGDLSMWLEDDPLNRFTELLDFIEERRGDAEGTAGGTAAVPVGATG